MKKAKCKRKKKGFELRDKRKKGEKELKIGKGKREVCIEVDWWIS
jgi:hypothetical protein